MERSVKVVRRTLSIVLLGGVLLLAAGLCVLRFAIGRVLLPATPAFTGPTPDVIERESSQAGNELLIRRYGKAALGCVVFFPGQHGYSPKYDVTRYTGAGLEVLLLAYPGQDGALGRAHLDEVEDLASRAVRRALESCPKNKVVLLGVSFGAMLAAYSSRESEPTGLVLVSAASSLSAAIHARLRSKWYLAPLRTLPVSQVLRHDYTLARGLENRPDGGAVIFQGTEDKQAPLSDLDGIVHAIEGLRLVEVAGGTHSTAFSLSLNAQVDAIRRILEQAPQEIFMKREKERRHDRPQPSAA